MIHDHLHVPGMLFCLFGIASTTMLFFAILTLSWRTIENTRHSTRTQSYTRYVCTPLVGNIVNEWTILFIPNGCLLPDKSGTLSLGGGELLGRSGIY